MIFFLAIKMQIIPRMESRYVSGAPERIRSLPENKMVWGKAGRSTRLSSNGKKGRGRGRAQVWDHDLLVHPALTGNALSWEESWVLNQRWDASQTSPEFGLWI